MAKLAGAVLLVLSLAGCRTGEDGPLTVRRYFDLSLAQTCDAVARCCGASAATSCWGTGNGGRHASELDVRLARGEDVFDLAEAALCLQRPLTCTTPRLSSYLDPCAWHNLERGTLAPGQTCTTATSINPCTPGFFCYPDALDLGTCQPEIRPGEACPGDGISNWRGCPFGELCLAAGVCGPPIPDGQPGDRQHCESQHSICSVTASPLTECVCVPPSPEIDCSFY